MADVVNHIYKPNCDDDSSKRIPIRVIVATRDGAVDKANRDAALAMFRDPAALQLDENHSSVKLPDHVADIRYRALANDIQRVAIRRFAELCKIVLDRSVLPTQRELILADVGRRYRKIIVNRIRTAVSDPRLYASAENELLLLMMFIGSLADIPPFDAANRALMVLSARHEDWR